MKYPLMIALLAGLGSMVALPVVAHAQQEVEESGRAAVRGKPDDRFCIKDTGSRVVATRNRSKKADEECAGDNGRVYTREEIERTGSVDIRDALRRLESSGR